MISTGNACKDKSPYNGSDLARGTQILPFFKDIDEQLKRWTCRWPGDGVGLREKIAGEILGQVVMLTVRQVYNGAVNFITAVSEKRNRRDPQWVIYQIYRIAWRNSGEITASMVVSELSVTEYMAKNVLEYLTEKRCCFAEYIEDTKIKRYTFLGLRKRYEMKTCDYCGSTFGADAVGDRCINCGVLLNHSSR